MQILHRLSKYRSLRYILFILTWPVLWFVAPLFLRSRLVITNSQGEILLVKHSFGADQWMLPGGGVKRGESPVDTAAREVHEELNLDVDDTRIHQLHDLTLIWKSRGLIFRVIICKLKLTEREIDDIETTYEIRETKWFKANATEVKEALPRDLSI